MKYLVSLILTLVTLAAQAQPTQEPAQEFSQEPPRQWTLAECISWAVEHSPAPAIQSARNEIARQDYREAIGRLLPDLNASLGARFNFGRNPGEDNTYVEANSFDNSYGIYSGLTVFGGGRAINSIRLQKINRATGRHLLDQRRDEVAFATMEAFFNVLYYKQMVALAVSQLDESRHSLLRTERMTELGIKGFPDVAEMRAKEASDSYSLTRQRNLLAIGIILLKECMNFPVDAPLDIAPLDPSTDPSTAAALDPAALATPVSAAAIYSRALSSLPEALVAESSARASEVALRIARGSRYPTLSLDAGLSTGFFHMRGGDGNIPFARQFTGKRGYYIGASLGIPIFNGFSTSANIRRSRSQLTIAQIERDAALRSLYTAIEQVVTDMNGSADQHAQAVRQREFVAIAHDANRRKYDQGLVSALELHTSANRLTQALADELHSHLAWILKKRMVDYYSGIPLIPSEN